MKEEEIIAEYVKEKYPEILQTTDFALFKLGKYFSDFITKYLNEVRSIFRKDGA